MNHRDRRESVAGPGPATSQQQNPTEPPRPAVDVFRLQRLVGNGATASAIAGLSGAAASANATKVVQRVDVTREDNINALMKELAEAAAHRSAWKDVALRLNGFSRDDLPAICGKIPLTQLQAAHLAVAHYLQGWPAQSAILAAIAGRAHKMKVGPRPSGSSIWAAYSHVGYNVWKGDAQTHLVWEYIGGNVGRDFTPGETCAARLSWGFNHGGFPLSGGFMNDPKTKFQGKSGDGNSYIIRSRDMMAYLLTHWGPPNQVLTTDTEAVAFEATLEPGEVAVFSGVHHSGLIMQGYSDGYVKVPGAGVMPVNVWKLP